MARIEIARLRKDHGMSQSELAQQLQITQSFLSAIENGKSPIPPEKEARLLELFSTSDLSNYTMDSQSVSPAKNAAGLSELELIRLLLARFHENAHSKDYEARNVAFRQRIKSLEANNNNMLVHNDALLQRNEQLAAKNDELREEIDRLHNEIYDLKLRCMADGNLKMSQINCNGESRKNEEIHHNGEVKKQ